MPNLPRQFTAWPDQHVDLTPAQIELGYEQGWRGCKKDPAAEEEARDIIRQQGYASFSDAAHDRGWAGSAAGKLVAHFVAVMQRWPDCWPGDAQTVGSCVSHSTRNAILYSLGCELSAGKPDPITNLLEGEPEVPTSGRLAGVLSSAANYWFRGYNSHGWSCPTSAKLCVTTVGCVVMKNYPELGVDLSRCTRAIECMYGAQRPPEAWQQEFAKHKLASIAEVNSFEEVRDALHNGYGISSCGGEGFSSTRDENGVSRRSGSWAHAMAYIGADDREETKAKYGGPLVLVQNSWGKWASGPRRIMGTNIDIPVGSFWARWSEISRRYAVAFSNVNGWPPQKVSYLTGVF